MRWERLFDDIEAQAEEAERAERSVEIADRTRREVGRQQLLHRLQAAAGQQVVVRVAGAGVVRGVVRGAGAGWLLLADAGDETLVAMRSVTSVLGLGIQATVPGTDGAVGARLGLGYVLRQVARDRAAVVLTLIDGTTVSGVVDRVGADFLDLADPPDSVRRVTIGEPKAGARAYVTVPFDALSLLRRTGQTIR